MADLRLYAPEDSEMQHEKPNDFFMVWTKTGWAPRKPHASFDAACKEAERLARLHPGKKFIVLKPVAKYHVAAKLTPPTPAA